MRQGALTNLPGATEPRSVVSGRAGPPEAIIIAIPLYRSPELVSDLADALLGISSELHHLRATIIFINDSPDDPELCVALAAARARLSGILSVDFLDNSENLGFIASANRALEIGLAENRDVILLNSDALPRPGAFAEMLAVAYLDPMIAVVSPRSDNATICNSPVAEVLRDRSRGRDTAYASHKWIERYLPRLYYVPTAVGFCLLIKRAMLAEFGLFDPVYGAGYHEENDFIRRCNQRGYRAVLANHAYVHHIGEVSFTKTSSARTERDRENHAILIARYPEYDRAITRYFASPEHRAEHVLGGLVPVNGRLAVLLDCSTVDPSPDVEVEFTGRMARALAERLLERFDVYIMCDEEAYRALGLEAYPGVSRRSKEDAMRWPAAVAFRLAPPDATALALLPSLAAVAGAMVRDLTAVDCQQLDDANLHRIWSRAMVNLDLIGFADEATRDRFGSRFAVPERMIQFVFGSRVDEVANQSPISDTAGDASDNVPVMAFEEATRRFDLAKCCRNIETARAFAESDEAEARGDLIAHLRVGIGTAQRAMMRLDDHATGLARRLSDARAREEQAVQARYSAEVDEQRARTRGVRASRSAIEAQARERLALEARRLAEVSASQAGMARAAAEQRVKEAVRREAAMLSALSTVPAAPLCMELHGMVPHLRAWFAKVSSPRRVIGDNPYQAGETLRGLRLVVTHHHDPEQMRGSLLRWSRQIILGGVLWLEGVQHEGAETFRTALAQAGFAIVASSQRRSLLTIRAVKTRGWPDFLAAAPAHLLIDFAYAYWLGRVPDTIEREAAELHLSSGVVLDEILIDIAASQRCWEHWRNRKRDAFQDQEALMSVASTMVKHRSLSRSVA